MPQPVRQWGRPAVLPLARARARSSDLWEEAVAAFLVRCEGKHLSPKTLDLYRHILVGGPNPDKRRVQLFLDDHDVRRVGQFSGALLRSFEAELFGAGLSTSTVVAYHRTLRTFFRFCGEEGLAIDPTVLTVEGQQRDTRRPDIFSQPELDKLLGALQKRPRDRVIVELFLRTGIRLDELCGLSIGDVITSPGLPVLLVHGKGRKDRHVPLDTKTQKMSVVLRRYVERERRGAGPDEPLFVGRGGAPLAATAVKSMLQRLGRSCRVDCHAHKFRHTFATRMLAVGADSLELQQALGHTTLTMVSRYVHFDATSLTRTWSGLET